MLINNRIKLEVTGHIARVTLARPEKMNAIDPDMFAAVPMVGEELRKDKSIRVVILDAEGDNFCSGLDKASIAGLMSPGKDADSGTLSVSDLSTRTHGIANAPQYAAWMWRELPMPVIVALRGITFGGGLQIALGGDMRYASADSQFSILEMKWGIIPDMSSTQVMRHLVADDVIRELTYTARIFSAQDALKWGFITDIVEDPLAHAYSIAEQIVAKNPVAVRAAKQMLDQAPYQTQAEGLLFESQEQDKILGTPNQIEAVMSQLEKRLPNYKD
ncbi:MAG: crotonase/enoyl-CoA hydratase family protein [Arenicella sp.]|nr:crotonase/enoyl-CoA hydratase family protein [Arenicella sp.]